MKHTQQKNNSNHGAVILIAVLMTSVVLAVGFGVYERTYRELVFGSFWQQTQVAFAAADSGLECALYYATRPPSGPNPQFSCFGQTAAWNFPTAGNTWDIWPSGFPIGGGCVKVTITNPSPISADFVRVTARGYNTCDTTNPRRVERGLLLDY